MRGDDDRVDGAVANNEVEVSREKEENASKEPPKAESQTARSRDIKCFKCLGKGHIASQCPNKRAMILSANGGVMSNSDGDGMLELEDIIGDEVVEHMMDGEALVLMHVLNTQIKVDEEK